MGFKINEDNNKGFPRLTISKYERNNVRNNHLMLVLFFLIKNYLYSVKIFLSFLLLGHVLELDEDYS